MNKKILMVFHDAGGAAAAEPFILDIKKHYDCRIIAFETASKVMGACEYESCLSVTPSEATELLKAYQPDLLITGTSTLAETIDRTFISAAKDLNIPTVSVLDYWCNYSERFMDAEGHNLACLPDKVAVMNKDAQDEMIEAGIPSDSIAIVGSARFEDISKQTYDEVGNKKTIAEEYNLDVRKPWILFLSQPYADTFGGIEKSREQWGYAEQDAISCLVDALQDNDHNTQLLVKLHPRETAKNYELFKGIPNVLVQDMDINFLMSACDIIAGMSTVALIDANLMEKPVVSIQPNQKNEDMCYLTRKNIISKCQTSAEISAQIKSILAGDGDGKVSADSLSFEGSKSHFLALIDDMLQEKR